MSRIARISLTTQIPGRLEHFYADAFGFRRIGTERHGGVMFGQLMGLDGTTAEAIVLDLGEQVVELLVFSRPGAPYPPDIAANDPRFQHFAIVVNDMKAAYHRLCGCSGWSAISAGGPQQLPGRSGGVFAFKFRDPEGHPLELLQFPLEKAPSPWDQPLPAGPCLGIDHAAITAASSTASVAYYRSLGFQVSAQTLNRGIEQDQLDGLDGAEVKVTALAAPGAAPPHVELLCYRNLHRPAPVVFASNDVAATRLVLEVEERQTSSIPLGDGRFAARVHDPTGHALILLGA